MMTNAPAISDLNSVKARNLVRGMISNPGPQQIALLLRKIQDSCSDADFKLSLEIIRASTIFKRNGVGRDFNREFPRKIDSSPSYDVKEIVAKLAINEEKLVALTNAFGHVLSAVSESNWPRAISACRDLAQQEGVSVCLLRLLHFIRNHAGKPELIKEVDSLLLSIKVDNVRYLSYVIRELSSGTTDYLNIYEKIYKSDDDFNVVLAKSFIDHVPRSMASFVATLNAFYLISVFDAFLYMCSVSRLELPFVPKLTERMEAAFNAVRKIPVGPSCFYDAADPYLGLDFFRESFLIIEVDRFFDYRTIHASIFNSIENKENRRIPFEKIALQKYFAQVRDVQGIGAEISNFSICGEAYSPILACNFQNSTALVYLLERKDGLIDAEEMDFVRLMSKTRDIGLICPKQHLESIKFHAKSEELKIVATCLSHIKERSQLREHELRAVIQNASGRRFSQNLTALLEYIYSISPAVSEHLVQITDETFLSKLFQIIKTPNAAIQERASILEWYGNKIGDVSYLERSKNLKIDVQINKAKGTIDDSRIYVDPVKFTQWINDNVLDELVLILESQTEPVEPLVVSLSWEKVKTGMSVFEILGSILVKCYEEFCGNKIFGIASYLGRRIRHGTLKGIGYNDVRNLATGDRYLSLIAEREFDSSYRLWLADYESALDALRDKFLHIQDKNKPDGLITRDFRSTYKRTTASHMLHDVIKSFVTNKSGVELPYIILEYCWRLIEEDLANIRKFLMEKKARYAVFRVEPNALGRLRQREAQEFCQELNSLTAEKFRTIASWFNKPSIASPSADIALLFKAVISEIKDYFPRYEPKVEVAEHELILNGGAYFVIYDALFILIYNAAAYGKSDGVLKMDVGIYSEENKTGVEIKISSMLQPGSCQHDVKKSIASALEGDCEDALIVEGRSGIKKLKRMEQTRYIDRVRYDFYSDIVQASFNFAIDY